MPSDDYANVVGGPLRLKGAKVDKKKKKKAKKDKSGLEKNLATGNDGDAVNKDKASLEKDLATGSDGAVVKEDEKEDDAPEVFKTEAELRFEEHKKKRLLKMAESSRPELLKTHKERVEELNTYLSKLSEHHDMPKIGPG